MENEPSYIKKKKTVSVRGFLSFGSDDIQRFYYIFILSENDCNRLYKFKVILSALPKSNSMETYRETARIKLLLIIY